MLSFLSFKRLLYYLTLICLVEISLATSTVPFLLIVLIPLADSFKVTNLFSSWTQILFFWRFGKNLLFVLLCAWETLFPAKGPIPVNWHLLDIFTPVPTILNWTINIRKFILKKPIEINYFMLISSPKVKIYWQLP